MTEITVSPKKDAFRGWPMVVFWAAMIVFAAHACTHMVAAGDTWVAMACGRHFVNHGVDTVEPFSANSHKAGPTDEQLQKFPEWTRPIIKKIHPTGWINQNWLTHVIFYKLAVIFGSEGEYNYNALVYWKFTVTLIAVVCTYYIGRLLGVSPPLAAAAACFGILVGRSFIDIRPAVFSNAMVPLYLLILLLATYRDKRYIWLIVPVIVFWCNIHGGYIYAFIVFVPFAGLHILLNLPRRWTIAVYASLTWLALYAITYKFMHHDNCITIHRILDRQFEPVAFYADGLFYVILLMVVADLIATASGKVASAVLYICHILATLILMIVLFSRHSLTVPLNVVPATRKVLSDFVGGSQVSFLMVSLAAIALGVILSLPKHRFVRLTPNALLHTIGAGFCAFVAMIIFNPFHLTNLTHTFEISISKHAASWRSVNEWHPVDWFKDKPNPVGEDTTFGVMFIIMLVALAVWIVSVSLRPRTGRPRRGRQAQKPPEGSFQWPRIDLAYLVICAFTVYLAIRSRRFIPLAGLAGCPVVAMFIQQAIQIFAARRQLSATGRLELPALPGIAGKTGIALMAAATVFLGIFWGTKYKRIYLDPWPSDGIRDSVFMRMTASNVKPFEVMQFIRENNLSGVMFNHWTEGGAIAFGEKTDPETGQIPLKLFMDGRAQAAYDHEKFRLWQYIKSGGPPAAQAHRLRGKYANGEYKPLLYEDFVKIGDWIDGQLKKYGVWIVLMPVTEINSDFMMGLQRRTNWRTAFMDNYQFLMFDTDTDRGKALLADILDGKARFPNEFSRNLTLAKNLLLFQDPNRARQGLAHAIKAFDLHNSQGPMQLIVHEAARRHPHLREAANARIKKFLDDFIENKDEYAREGGYVQRLVAAMIAANHLAADRRHPEYRTRYGGLEDEYRKERQLISIRSRW